MQYAYVINKNTTTGIVANEEGKFTLKIQPGDTLTFSYLGYFVTKVYTHTLKDSVKNAALNIKVYLKSKAKELNPVIVRPNSFSKESKEMYKRKIDEYHRGIASPLASPIDALYYTFSKKGKELKKLSFLYDQLLIDEIIEARLNPELVRVITGNDTLDVPTFLNYCYLPNQFVVSASDYELFYSIKKYYLNYLKKAIENK